jgi:hypothetical protein
MTRPFPFFNILYIQASRPATLKNKMFLILVEIEQNEMFTFSNLVGSGRLWTGFRIRIDLMRIRIRIRIQHFSNCESGFRIRIPDPDPGFDDLKLKKNYIWKFIFY